MYFIKYFYLFFHYIKKWIIQLIIKETEKKILNRAKDYYENDKERLKKQARDNYRNLSEEDIKKKREYGKNRYHNVSEEKKQKLKQFQKKYPEAKKSKYNNE